MPTIKATNKLLRQAFGEQVQAAASRGCLVLTGALDNWNDIVYAGRLSVDRRRWLGVVNNIRYTGGDIPHMRLPAIRDDALEGARPDVLVIGAGVTGCAIARELTRYRLNVLLIDKEHDVATHASSRNDGMVHPGVDLRKGTLKYACNMRGNRLYDALCDELGVEFKRPGQLLCFTSAAIKPILRLSLPYWKWLGIPGVRVVGKSELHEREPNLRGNIQVALSFPNAGIVCPYGLTIALAENAVQNGAQLSLNTAVLGMEVVDGEIRSVSTNRGTVYPSVVVNAAGVWADTVADMAGDRFYSIHPRKGTNSILDSKYSDSIVRTVAANFGAADTKSAHTKGGGIVRTVDDNLLVGPNAIETFAREDFATERSVIHDTFQKHVATAPNLRESAIITYFTGVRAPTYEEDFVICKGIFTRNIVHAAGIQSPGLTAAPAIGIDAARYAAELCGKTIANPDFNPVRQPIVHTKKLPQAERDALIQAHPDYGVIVCRCEEVSRGEILDALRRPVPCDTIDGVKRRVRPGMGRCQGGFCGPLVASIISKELNIPLEQVRKGPAGSTLLCGETKGGSEV